MDIYRSGGAAACVPAQARRLRRVLSAPGHANLEAMRFGSSPVPCSARSPETVEHPLLRGVWASAPNGGGCYSAVAGPADLFLEMVARTARPEVEFAVLVLRHPGGSPLTESARDRLWDAFRVPVYELLCGFDGKLLAYECEARCGLHVTGNALFEEHRGRMYVTSLTDRRAPAIRLDCGIAGYIATTRCDCGRPGEWIAAAGVCGGELSSAAD